MFAGIYRAIIIPGVLRRCKISSIHSMEAALKLGCPLSDPLLNSYGWEPPRKGTPKSNGRLKEPPGSLICSAATFCLNLLVLALAQTPKVTLHPERHPKKQKSNVCVILLLTMIEDFPRPPSLVTSLTYLSNLFQCTHRRCDSNQRPILRDTIIA